jgi:hypothetical protein
MKTRLTMVLCVAGLLGAAAPAQAIWAGVSPDNTLHLDAFPLEKDVLTVVPDPSNPQAYLIYDAGSGYSDAGPGCTDLNLQHTVIRCEFSGTAPGALTMNVWDATDTVVVTGTFSHYDVDGGPGNDHVDLTGVHAASGVVRGSAGSDTLDTRNGVPDSVDCGDGTDVAFGDPFDTFASCWKASA